MSTQTEKYTSNPFAAAARGLGKSLFVNPIATLLLALFPLALIFGVYILAAIVEDAFDENLAVAALVGVVAAVAAIIIIARAILGAIFVLKASHDNLPTTASKVLSIDSSPFVARYILIVLANIALFVVATAIAAVVARSVENGWLAAGLCLAVYLAAFTMVVRWSLALFVLVNENANVVTSLKRSFELTKGHFVEVLAAIIAQSIISGNGLLMVVASVSGLETRYAEISSYKKSKSKRPAVHWMNWVLVIVGSVVASGYIAVVSYIYNHDYIIDDSGGINSDYCYITRDLRYRCAANEKECRSDSDCRQSLEEDQDSFDQWLESPNTNEYNIN